MLRVATGAVLSLGVVVALLAISPPLSANLSDEVTIPVEVSIHIPAQQDSSPEQPNTLPAEDAVPEEADAVGGASVPSAPASSGTEEMPAPPVEPDPQEQPLQSSDSPSDQPSANETLETTSETVNP